MSRYVSQCRRQHSVGANSSAAGEAPMPGKGSGGATIPAHLQLVLMLAAAEGALAIAIKGWLTTTINVLLFARRN